MGKSRRLEIRRLRFRFADETRYLFDLRDVSLSWHGALLVRAESGAGKTTFFNIFDRLELIPHECEVVCDGLASPRDTAMVGNDAGLLPWYTVQGNIDVVGDPSFLADRLAEYLDDLRLGRDILKMYPYQLSFGMYKRAELLVSISVQPKLLLLDEFFSSVDSESRTAAIVFLSKFFGEIACVFTSHTLDGLEALDFQTVALERSSNDYTITDLKPCG